MKIDKLNTARVLTSEEMQAFKGGASECNQGCTKGCKNSCISGCISGDKAPQVAITIE